MHLPTTETSNPLPPGSYPAMLTAFHDDGSFDWQGIDRLIDDCLDHGAAGIFACGLSAEIMQMDGQEKGQLAEYIVKRVDGRAPVVATAITSVSVEDQAAFVRRIYDGGADAVAIGVCQLATPEEDDQAWIDHATTLLEQIPDEVRLAMYETPQPYHRLLTGKSLRWAADTGRFFFLKDTCGCIDTIRDRLTILAVAQREHQNFVGFARCGCLWLLRHWLELYAPAVRLALPELECTATAGRRVAGVSGRCRGTNGGEHLSCFGKVLSSPARSRYWHA